MKPATVNVLDITYTSYSLPYEIREYAADATSFIRRTYIDYNLNPAYIARRIIGLKSAVHVVDHNNQYVTKTPTTTTGTMPPTPISSTRERPFSMMRRITVRVSLAGAAI